MATLEKIRSKSVLLFAIIIVALLAFILGDFLTSGRTYFGSGTTVAKAAGHKVDYNEYQQRVSQASEQAQQQGRTVDGDELSQQVISELLFEELLKQEYKDLGITVTDKEITEAMTGEVPHRSAQQFIYTLSQQLGLPAPSGAAVYDAMMNPAKYGLPVEVGQQLRQLWAAQEADVESTLKQEKFYRLVGGLFRASEIDAKAVYNDNATTRHLAYAAKSVSQVPDADVEVSDADLKALWESEKSLYRIDQQVRDVDYIYMPIEPSMADRIAGQQVVENAVVALREQPGTDAVSSDIKFVVNRVQQPKSKISDARLKAFADTAVVGQVAILSNVSNKYTIAKLVDVTPGIDSINVSFVARADQGSLDSVMVQIAEGKSIAELIDGSEILGTDSVWTALEGTGVSPRIKEALTSAAIGQAFVLTDSVQGQPVQTLYRVNRRHAPVSFYDVALIEYTVDPSNETISDISNNMRTFISANSNEKDFAENAANAGYTLLTAQVSNNTPRVGNASDSRSLVKWAMEAKKGQVSPVFQDNKQTYMMAVAVHDIYNDYIPFTASNVNQQLRMRALNAKKADKLLEQYAGKANDVAGYAGVMEVEASEGDVNFNSPVLLTIGMGESALQGQIAAAEQGQLVGPVKGNNGVLVFTVTEVNDQNRPYNYDEYAARFNQLLGAGRINPMQLLLGKDKVTNYSLNFIQSSFE